MAFLLNKTTASRHITRFTRDMATLLRAGVPITKGLPLLMEQQSSREFRAQLVQIHHTLKAGNPLSLALAQFPESFDPLYINLVKAAELAETLPGALHQIATFRERTHRTKAKMKAALTHPITVISVAFLVTMSLIVFVIPRFEMIYSDVLKGAPLPALTQVILSISLWSQGHIVLLMGMVAGVFLLYKILLRSVRLGEIWARLALRVPSFGGLILKFNTAHFTRTLGTLLANGVPTLEALSLARTTITNRALNRTLVNAHGQVRDGKSLAVALGEYNTFPKTLTSMIRVGEETGCLAEILTQVADDYEHDLQISLSQLTASLEPLLIVLLALIIGTLVIALFLPIVGIIDSLTVFR